MWLWNTFLQSISPSLITFPWIQKESSSLQLTVFIRRVKHSPPISYFKTLPPYVIYTLSLLFLLCICVCINNVLHYMLCNYKFYWWFPLVGSEGRLRYGKGSGEENVGDSILDCDALFLKHKDLKQLWHNINVHFEWWK